MACNLNLQAMGYAPLTAPPTPDTFDTPGFMSISGSPVAPLTATFDYPSSTPTRAIIYASPLYSAGRNINNPQLTLMGVFNLNSSTLCDFNEAWVARYGAKRVDMQVIVRSVIRGTAWPYDYYPQVGSVVL